MSTCLAHDLLNICYKGEIHSHVASHGLYSNSFLCSHLIRFLATSGRLFEANQNFDSVCRPSIYTWTSMISGNAKNRNGYLALEIYKQMGLAGLESDKQVYLACLKACATSSELEKGRLIHDEVIRSGHQFNLVLGNTVVDMYAKCGSLREARQVFDRFQVKDLVSWNAMIAGYVFHAEGLSALELFSKMQKNNIKPNKFTLSSVTKACGSIGAIQQGRAIHYLIIRDQLASDIFVGSTLIDMYAKCASLGEARKVFDALPNPSLVAWNSMMAGYAQEAEGIAALQLFGKMQREGIKPDQLTFLSIMKACGNIGAVVYGRIIHNKAIEQGSASDVMVSNALIDMYTKCGAMEEAIQVFIRLPRQTVVSWSSIIGGYAYSGNIQQAMKFLQEMQVKGIVPNAVTFGCVLIACSNVGLVDEGLYFMFMKNHYGIKSDTLHLNCMVDLLGHAAYWSEAENLLQAIDGPNFTGWISLLSACQMQGNVRLGQRCFDKVTGIDPCATAGYVLMANMYAGNGMMAN